MKFRRRIFGAYLALREWSTVHVAFAAAIVSVAAASSARESVASIFGTNLIVNPGAEAGAASSDGYAVVSIPGWTTTIPFTAVAYDTPGGFPSTGQPLPTNPGRNFFSAGHVANGSSFSSAFQDIDVSSGSELIDAGAVPFAMEGWMGGFEFHPDQITIVATFFDATSSALGSSSIGPVTNIDRGNKTSFLFRSTTGLVPASTRSIRVEMRGQRVLGAYSDGYADNLSLVLQGSPVTGVVPEPAPFLIWSLLGAAASVGAVAKNRAIPHGVVAG